MTIIRAHRIRLNPTPEQKQYFVRCSGVARFTWNWALAEYKRCKGLGRKVNWNLVKKDLRSRIDTEFPWMREVTASAPEQAIGDLRKTISTYYKAKKTNPKLKFPGRRSRKKGIGGFELSNIYLRINGHSITFDKGRCGAVNMAEALRFEGKVMAGRIKEKAGHWYLTVTVETDKPEPAQGKGIVGIDFGLKQFATLSTGKVYETQGHLRQAERHLRGLQRGLSRKKKFSQNWLKAKRKVGRAMGRVANQRTDFLHKFTTEVVQDFTVVCIEDLNLQGLMRSRLAKSFADAGIGEGIRQLEYKANWYGAILQRVGRFYASSRLCSVCGWKNESLTLADRVWTCLGCHTVHDRDFNASVNIRLEGVSLLAGGTRIGVTPVEGEALACTSAQAKPYLVETGTLHLRRYC